ncbi:MAG: cation:proton antiporter [Candidatus Asgardarchaeia archaeon]
MEQESIIIAAMILVSGFLAIEIGISTAILEIIAGVIGANFLGISDVYWLDFLSDFGLLGLMFYAGFETDPKLLKKNLLKNMIIGLASYFVPFTFVIIVTLLILNFSIQGAIVLGISLSTTSVALVYAVLRDKSMITSEAGQIILGSAMVADILSMLSLTVLVGVYGIYTLIYSAILILFLYISPRVGKVIFSRYGGHAAEIEIKFILLLLLTMPFFSERVGISEAVFAFLLGILFSEMISEDKSVEEKLRGIIFGFLAPTFFFKAGLLFDLKAISSVKIIELIILLGIIAFFGKYFSVYLASKTLLDGKVAPLFGLFFNFRLTFGIIAILFGLENSFISHEIYSAVLMIILVSSGIASLLLKVTPHEL